MKNSAEANSEAPEKEGRKASAFEQIVWAIFFAGCVQYILFGTIGVVRGYSFQSTLPQFLLLMGFFPRAICYKKKPFIAFILPSTVIITTSISMSQGGHEQAGDALYKKGKYEEAISEYQKETGTWYRRIQYNYHEDPSMDRMARSYTQLGEFEKAREIYETIITMFSGLFKERAEERLQNFEKTDELKALLEKQTDDRLKAMILFDLALEYRSLPCVKKAYETYGIVQTLDIYESQKKQALEFSVKLFEKEMSRR